MENYSFILNPNTFINNYFYYIHGQFNELPDLKEDKEAGEPFYPFQEEDLLNKVNACISFYPEAKYAPLALMTGHINGMGEAPLHAGSSIATQFLLSAGYKVLK